MITKEEIGELRNFNLPMLKEALRQTELRVNYTIDTKKRLDGKAFTLLSVFLSFATIFVTLMTSTFFIESNICNKLVIPFFFSATSLIIGSIYLLKALRSHKSAAIGRYPDTWLYDKTIISDGHDAIEHSESDKEGFIISHILHSYQSSIEIGDDSNDVRVYFIDKAIIYGISSPILLLISSLLLILSTYYHLS